MDLIRMNMFSLSQSGNYSTYCLYSMWHLHTVGYSINMFTPCWGNIRAIHSTKYQADLEWSWKPIFLWMQLLGIPAGRSHLSSVVRRTAVLIVGVAMVIWKVSSSIYFFTGKISKIIRDGGNEPGFKPSKTEFWTDTLNYIQLFFSGISINLCFFIVSHLQWEALWENVCEIEDAMRSNETSFRSLRKMAWVAITVLILVSHALKMIKIYTRLSKITKKRSGDLTSKKREQFYIQI